MQISDLNGAEPNINIEKKNEQCLCLYETAFIKKFLVQIILDLFFNLFTEIFQFRDDVINLSFHIFLFDLDGSDLLFKVTTTALLVLFEFEDEVLG